jgi:hypothetical protein
VTVDNFITVYSIGKSYSRADSCSADRDLLWLRSVELNTKPNYEPRQNTHTLFCNINFNIILPTTGYLPGCLYVWHLWSEVCLFRSGKYHPIFITRKYDWFLRFSWEHNFCENREYTCVCSQRALNVRVATLKMSLCLCKAVSW